MDFLVKYKTQNEKHLFYFDWFSFRYFLFNTFVYLLEMLLRRKKNKQKKHEVMFSDEKKRPAF